MTISAFKIYTFCANCGCQLENTPKTERGNIQRNEIVVPPCFNCLKHHLVELLNGEHLKDLFQRYNFDLKIFPDKIGQGNDRLNFNILAKLLEDQRKGKSETSSGWRKIAEVIE